MTFHEKAQANTIRAGFQDMERDFLTLAESCKPYTMTTMERMYALWKAVHHILDRDIKGDIVECGVWRGGSMMLAAWTLLSRNVTDRDMWLYDTFRGQPEPRPMDRDIWGQDQRRTWAEHVLGGKYVGSQASFREVQNNMSTTGYPGQFINMVAGMVENTIPESIPDRISILRLDTDWHVSTKHTLEHLYPRLSRGGILIIDDYGHLEGARQATDEYFLSLPDAPMLTRVDYSGRIAVKA